MDEQYPPLLSVKHLRQILSCSRSTAYNILNEPHRPVWIHGKIKRMLRDEFFEQLKQESRQQGA